MALAVARRVAIAILRCAAHRLRLRLESIFAISAATVFYAPR